MSKPRCIVFIAPGQNRSRIIGEAMFEGMRKLGEDVAIRSSLSYRGEIEARCAIFYGLACGLRRVLADYKREARAFYIDLGYWGRRKKSRWDGYHKIVLNSRHPTAYFQRREHPADRFMQFGVPIRPWRRAGRNIIVAGMSAKAAFAEGLKAEAWERETIMRLSRLTKRPIIYRPKPNWTGARPIAGAQFQRGLDIADALRDCHALVTHHSNCAVDALLAGVPVISPFGAASALAEPRLENIENPRMPEGREQWAADLAYTQYSLDEMASGFAWRMLTNEGLTG